MRKLVLGALLTCSIVVPLYGVMFASDSVTLTEDGVPITDNSVLMIDSRNPAMREVVQNGTFRTNQVPGPQVFELRRMAGPVTTWKEWEKSGKGDEPAYEAYLDGLSPLYSVTIELPEATDKTVSQKSPPGEPGGVIGTPRHFTVDLKTKDVKLAESKR